MALYEILLALHKDDNPKPSVKEGDLYDAYDYPKDWGAKILDEWLILIVSTSVSLKTLKLMCQQPIYRNLKTSKIISYYMYDMATNDNPANESNFVKIIKTRYSIPFTGLLSKISGIDFAKVRDSKKKYQPCKKTSQIINYFDGRPGYHLITAKDIDTSTSEIDKEQEVIIDLDLTPIIYDKLTKEMVNP